MTGPDTKEPRHQGTASDPQADPCPADGTVTEEAAATATATGRTATDAIEEAEVVSVTPPEGTATPAGAERFDRAGDAAELQDATGAPAAGAQDAAAQPSGHADQGRAEQAPPEPDAQTADRADADPPPARPAAPPQAAARAAGPPPRRGSAGGFIALVLGGAIAAGAGFALARFVPEGWPVAQPAADPALVGRLDALSAQVAGLADRIEALPSGAGAADIAGLAADIAALKADVAALQTGGGSAAQAADVSAQIEALRAEVAALRAGAGDASAAGSPSPDVAALAAEVAALRAQVEAGPDAALAEQIAALTAAAEAERAAAAARAEALRLEAERATAAMRARAAVLRLQAAIDAGGPLDSALADLAAAGVAVPPALAERAAGVPTLAMLQAAFPEAARAALAASATVPPEGGLGERLIAFLRAQTGARSLTPRAGDDPDAVLSRAEAALRAGDLAAVLAALDALPETAKPALAAWRAQAEARAAAVAAAADLAATLAGE